VNKNEPKPEGRAPACPKQLDAQARGIWKQVVEQLTPLGLIAITDAALLSTYSQTYSLWLTLTAELKHYGAFIQVPVIEKSGEVLRDFNGNVITTPVKNPRLPEMRLLAHQLRIMASELGMTPTARARLSVPKKDEDEMSDWVKRANSLASG